MKKAAVAPFATEAALCAEFISHATRDGTWVAYPETAGWDILLVRKADGFQIGVQAKLKFNAKVLEQAVPDSWYDFGTTGPDCRAILVPEGAAGLARLCRLVQVVVITQYMPEEHRHRHSRAFYPELPTLRGQYFDDRHWPEWLPSQRCKVPEFVPDVVAGASGPVQLSEWKIKALKLSFLLEQRPVTRADFKALQMDPGRWTQFWLEKTERGYVAGPNTPNFKAQHPVNYEQIKAQSAQWMAVQKVEAAALL